MCNPRRPHEDRRGFRSPVDLVSQFDCVALETNTTDVEEIYLLTLDILKLMKEREQPGFLRLRCYRYLEHVGINQDFHLGYRPKEDFDRWFERDPIAVQRKKLLSFGVAEGEIVELEKSLDAKALKSIELAKTANFPGKDEIFKRVFHGE